jgi:cytoskeletal protein CcmA (bactofilin family)
LAWQTLTFQRETLDAKGEVQLMNMLARSTKGPVQLVTAPISEPQSAPPRAPEQHAAASPRTYAGPSIISAALSVTGRLESAGDIQVDGKVEGDIRGQTVRIGNGAMIKGTIFGDVVELAGTVEGKIEAGSAVLTKTARMTGDILHQSLQVEQGAFFNGNSRPHQAKTAPKQV